MNTNSNSRKVLIPLAALLAAGAVAIGSGADFTSTSESTVSVTAGELIHLNDADLATLTISNLKPGASESGTLNISNTGSLNSTLELTGDYTAATAPAVPFEAGVLELEILQDGVNVWGPAPFESMPADLDLGNLNTDADGTGPGTAAGDTDVTFTVTLLQSAGNLNQGATATATFDFVTTQTAATDDESSVLGW